MDAILYARRERASRAAASFGTWRSAWRIIYCSLIPRCNYTLSWRAPGASSHVLPRRINILFIVPLETVIFNFAKMVYDSHKCRPRWLMLKVAIDPGIKYPLFLLRHKFLAPRFFLFWFRYFSRIQMPFVSRKIVCNNQWNFSFFVVPFTIRTLSKFY